MIEAIPIQEKKDDVKKSIDILEEWLKKKYDFVYNLITREILFKAKNESVFKQFCDEDMATIYIRSMKDGLSFSESKIEKLIFSEYVSKRINPIKDFFDQLELDEYESESEIKRLYDSLKLVGNQNYYSLFRRWLISCYACVMGYCPNHVCFVLVGGQGIYKSTWLDLLCPSEISGYSVRTKLDLNPSNKDTWNLLAEKFLINVDDQLSTLFYKDAEVIKTYISANEVTVRKAFSRKETKRVRIANFVASVNSVNFLTDTENRRYLIFEVTNCETHIGIDYKKVWSEVKYLYEVKKETCFFNKEETKQQKLINEKYTETTQEDEWLKTTFRPASPVEYEKHYVKFMNASEILKELNFVSSDKLNFNRLIRSIKRQGYEQIGKNINGKSLKCYVLVKLEDDPYKNVIDSF